MDEKSKEFTGSTRACHSDADSKLLIETGDNPQSSRRNGLLVTAEKNARPSIDILGALQSCSGAFQV